jgi:hypothetical protein
MKLGAPALKGLLDNNVLEIKFTRRRPKANLPLTRRMLCTNSQGILLSENGLSILNYHPAGGGALYNKELYNIVIAWDIMKQDYRCISADNCELVTQLPADDTFWEYFNNNILVMTTDQKNAFMNS